MRSTSQTPVHDRARRCMPKLLQSKGVWEPRPSLKSFGSWSRECHWSTSANRPGTRQKPTQVSQVKSLQERTTYQILWKNKAAATSTLAKKQISWMGVELPFLSCSLPKPCAACHTGIVGNMELKSRSKRRSQMPMCPPDISTGTPWKKWVDSSLNRIRPKNQQEHGQQKKTCVLLCGWTWGEWLLLFPLPFH